MTNETVFFACLYQPIPGRQVSHKNAKSKRAGLLFTNFKLVLELFNNPEVEINDISSDDNITSIAGI